MSGSPCFAVDEVTRPQNFSRFPSIADHFITVNSKAAHISCTQKIRQMLYEFVQLFAIQHLHQFFQNKNKLQVVSFRAAFASNLAVPAVVAHCVINTEMRTQTPSPTTAMAFMCAPTAARFGIPIARKFRSGSTARVLVHASPRSRMHLMDSDSLQYNRKAQLSQDLQLVSKVVHAEYAEALQEMMSHDSVYTSCRAFVIAVLYAIENDISVTLLIYELSKFRQTHLPTLTDLQRETIQGFIRTIYYVTNILDSYDAGAPVQFALCEHVYKSLSNGKSLADICAQFSCFDESSQVMGRYNMPPRWTCITACVVIYLRREHGFGNRSLV